MVLATILIIALVSLSVFQLVKINQYKQTITNQQQTIESNNKTIERDNNSPDITDPDIKEIS